MRGKEPSRVALEFCLVGAGMAAPTCAAPIAVAMGPDNSWGAWKRHRCERSDCPVCIDKGYVTHEAQRTLKAIQRTVYALVKRGMGARITDHGVQPLRLFHTIVSIRKDWSPNTMGEYENAKKKVYRALKDSGILFGWVILHPFRGPHRKHDTGAVIRASMDRDNVSAHFHVLAIGYRTTPSRKGAGIMLKHQALFRCDQEMPWGKVETKLRYCINHCGSMGGHQAITRFGQHLPDRPQKEAKKQEERPEAERMIIDPMTGETLRLKDVLVQREHSHLSALPMPGETNHIYGVGGAPSPFLANNFDLCQTRWWWHGELKAPPDDSKGEQWDIALISSIRDTMYRVATEKIIGAPQALIT